MAFGFKIKHSKLLKRVIPLILTASNLRGGVVFGLTSKNRLVRQIRRSLRGRTGQQMALGGYQPTNAVNYQPRTIASLMGGV